MQDEARQFTALITRWDGRWEAFVLDDTTGYLGTVHAAELDDIDGTVRALLATLFNQPSTDFQVRVIRP